MNCALLEKIETSLQRAAAVAHLPQPTSHDGSRGPGEFADLLDRRRGETTAEGVHPLHTKCFSNPLPVLDAVQGVTSHLIRTRAPCCLDLKDDETLRDHLRLYPSRRAGNRQHRRAADFST